MNNRGTSNKNRKAAFAGKFYPGNKNALLEELDQLFLQAKKPQKTRKLRALIAPHAGYVFSGPVAASAFNQIPENPKIKRVFLLASSHQFHFDGASVFIDGNYQTPLGEIKVDYTLGKQLIKNSGVFKNNVNAHQHEHSLEVLLPFLQYKLGTDFLLVPLILGINKASRSKELAEVLQPYFIKENLFVVSTDLSHYPKYTDAQKIDSLTLDAISKNKPNVLLSTLEENQKKKIKNLSTSLCGWTSVLTLIYLTKKEKLSIVKIDYQNSGDNQIYGDKNRVVGYGALAVFEKEKKFVFSDKEKKELLEKAHSAISNYITTGKKQSHAAANTDSILNKKAGAFVSIYVKNELRGCIGGFAQEKTLIKLVQQMAISAAKDRRFTNIRRDELDKIKLEISVLSPLTKIELIEEIELGRHGIYIKQDFNSGTFLPQVATKTGWSREEFLSHCSRDKAGIGWDGWKQAEIFKFEAVILSEQ